MTAQDTGTIILPDLISTCPFKLECNQEYEMVSAETNAWLTAYGILYSESMTKYNLYWALAYPHASRTRLGNTCDAFTLFFLIDDLLDTSYGKGISDKTKQQLLKNTLDCFQPTGSFKPLTSFAEALRDWWQRMRYSATPHFQERFINSYRIGLETILSLLADKKTCQSVPNLGTYIRIRRKTSFGDVGFAFIEYIFDIVLPDECWSNEALQRLMNCMIDISAFANDIYSFNVEQIHDQYNLITVLMHDDSSLTIQQAMDRAGQMIIDRYNDFERIRREIPSWGKEIDAQVEKYINEATCIVSGNLHWRADGVWLNRSPTSSVLQNTND
ncbi:unnamed protein product [Adineta steineri]|uniref:Terpene synthase n=1 Tax=Adineta steineri TaxID=433720 RepID=A0A814HCG5_9BILA|nr:unnamed protein product [Adineta steineri]CAF3644962.1 unnamed protein product [Adineta steineri]